MSWHLTGIVSRKRAGSQSRKLLLLSMADKANDDGTGIYASFQTLAEMCESSRATVKRLIKQFEDEGLVVHVGMRGNQNGAQTNDYSINLEALAALPDIETKKRKTRVTVNPVQEAPGSLTDETRVTMTPKPILEPILPPPGGEGRAISEGKQERQRAYIIGPYAEYAPEFVAVATENGLLNGSGANAFRKFARWYSDREIKHTHADWLIQFGTWCAGERVPEKRETHDQRANQGGDAKLAAANDRARVARRSKAVGSAGGGGGIVGAVLRRKARRAAEDAERAAADQSISVEYAIVS